MYGKGYPVKSMTHAINRTLKWHNTKKSAESWRCEKRGDTMIAANAFHEALKAFVQPAQLQKALIAVLDVHATHRARLATVLTAAAHRMGQANWLDELSEMEDTRK